VAHEHAGRGDVEDLGSDIVLTEIDLALLEALVRVAELVDGHAHLGTYAATTDKGIPVYNCARSVEKPSGRPYALIEI
jgi:hypothetical protein